MDEPADDIMAATYCALCEHGYAELTMQRIADHSSKSKAALHYHYDTKTELLEAFLDHVAEQFETEVTAASGSPRTRLRSIVDRIFDPPRTDHGEYATALLAIKAQAPYDDAYRERLRTLDERIQRLVAETVQDGVEQGVFAETDPQRVARFLATAADGAHARAVALDEDPAATRALVASYLEAELDVSLDAEGSA
jgi:AcrR family transcriptional regulator